ncbi:uncharacterized protein PG998_002497 [Apiospora kogelbergensis]|uniref:Uncharacterized protein n=1 Tax=Apiospora kogelbergensis TaxID=1337665 RepID=A0AAW0QFN4_9PEZI
MNTRTTTTTFCKTGFGTEPTPGSHRAARQQPYEAASGHTANPNLLRAKEVGPTAKCPNLSNRNAPEAKLDEITGEEHMATSGERCNAVAMCLPPTCHSTCQPMRPLPLSSTDHKPRARADRRLTRATLRFAAYASFFFLLHSPCRYYGESKQSSFGRQRGRMT